MHTYIQYFCFTNFILISQHLLPTLLLIVGLHSPHNHLLTFSMKVETHQNKIFISCKMPEMKHFGWSQY